MIINNSEFKMISNPLKYLENSQTVKEMGKNSTLLHFNGQKLFN